MDRGHEEEQGPQYDGEGANDFVVLDHQHRAGADGGHLMRCGHGDGPEHVRGVEDPNKGSSKEGGEASRDEEKS